MQFLIRYYIAKNDRRDQVDIVTQTIEAASQDEAMQKAKWEDVQHPNKDQYFLINWNAQQIDTTAKRVLTKGEYRVGIDFNPGGHPKVNSIKRAAAALIDNIEEVAASSENGEVKRLAALAQTEIESAAMWGVKAATKPAQ